MRLRGNDNFDFYDPPCLFVNKVDQQPGYILHRTPHRETSLLLDVFTPDYGRVRLSARGARRMRSELRGVVLPFCPLLFSWFGQQEVRTLHRVQWQGGVLPLAGLALLSGFYLNELLMRLIARDDPHPATWQLYDQTVRQLAGPGSLPIVLRRFELALIRQLGFGPELSCDHTGRAIEATKWYDCVPASAPSKQPYEGAKPCVRMSGATLLALRDDDFSVPQTAHEARLFLRLLLDDLLAYKPLATSTISKQLSGFKKSLMLE